MLRDRKYCYSLDFLFVCLSIDGIFSIAERRVILVKRDVSITVFECFLGQFFCLFFLSSFFLGGGGGGGGWGVEVGHNTCVNIHQKWFRIRFLTFFLFFKYF